MAIVAGFDVHKAQITFDALDTETGELHRGRIAAKPEAVRDWVKRFDEVEVEVASIAFKLIGCGATSSRRWPHTRHRQAHHQGGHADRHDPASHPHLVTVYHGSPENGTLIRSPSS